MVASSVTILSLPNGVLIPGGVDGILRPQTTIKWSGGVGAFDIRYEWDTVNTFNSGNYKSDLNTGVTSPDTGTPPGDLGPIGTLWYFRAIVIDKGDQANEVQNVTHDHTGGTFRLTFDGQETVDIDWDASTATLETALENLSTITDVTVTGTPGDWDIEFVNPGLQDVAPMTVTNNSLTGGTVIDVTTTTPGKNGHLNSSTRSMNWFDQRLEDRHLYLHANVGVAFTPKDDPAGGWGTGIGGVTGPDGDNRLQDRHLYLLANVGVGFRHTDAPPGDEDTAWGTAIGGTWVDGDERLFDRHLYLLKNLTLDMPSPFIFNLMPNFGRPGESFTINGWAFKPEKSWSQGIAYTGATGTTLSDGYYPKQNGSETEIASFLNRTTNDDTVTFDLGAPRLVNEVRVWYRKTDPFVSVSIDHADSPGGPWTNVGSGTPATLDPLGTGWATIERWSIPSDWGSHRYWRFVFVDGHQLGEIEVNQRLTVPTGDIEPRLDDTDTDWLLTISQDFYDRIIAQAPASTEPGGVVRVENLFPDPDLVSNTKGYTFLDPLPAKGVGVLVKIFDRDAPQQLLAIAGDTYNTQYQSLLSGVGSAEFTIPRRAPFWNEVGADRKYNVVRIYLDQVERWWGFISFTDETLVDDGGTSHEATRFMAKEGISYLSRGVLFPKNWPSVEDPTWQFVDATAGQIIREIVEAAQARGTMPRLVLDFSDTLTSDNVPWEDSFTLEFQAGTKIERVIAQLVALGIDIKLNSQFELKVYNQLGFDRPTDPSYTPMMVGHTIQAMAEAVDFENPANVALISYGTGKYLAYVDPVSIAEWERFEGFSQSDADNATSAQRIAEAAVLKQGQPLDQIAVAVQRITGQMEPYVDFDLGDTVRIASGAPEHRGFDKKYRVRAITVDASDVRNPTFVLDVNSIRIEKIIEHEIKLALQQQNTLPVEVGSSVPGGAAPRDHSHGFPTAGGDLEGGTDDPTVVGWQGVPIDAGPYANGDMWYYDSGSNIWKPVEGAKNVGRIPVIQADGSIEWEDPSGGGAGAGAVLLQSLNNQDERNYSTPNTWQDVASTTMTFTANVVGVHIMKVFFHWRVQTNNWLHHKVRILMDGATTGVLPVEHWVAQWNNGASGQHMTASVQFEIDIPNLTSKSIKLQTHDGNTSLQRLFCITDLQMWGPPAP